MREGVKKREGDDDDDERDDDGSGRDERGGRHRGGTHAAKVFPPCAYVRACVCVGDGKWSKAVWIIHSG